MGNDTFPQRRPALRVMVVVLSLAFALLAGQPAAWAAAAANDNFAAAQVLSGSLPITATGTNVDATREPDEPVHAFAGSASVWFNWTPSTPGQVTIETCGSSFDTLIGVYTGETVDALAAVAANDDGCGVQSRVSFSAVAGTAYRIAVDGFAEAQGSIALTIRTADPPPPNDNFADAQELDGDLPLNISGSSVNATLEPDEINLGFTPITSTVWYRWTASDSRDVVVETCGSDYDTLLVAFTGSSLDALTFTSFGGDDCGSPFNQSRLTFRAEAGMTYNFVVVGRQQGNITFSVRAGIDHDNFDNAQGLSGSVPFTVTGSNVGGSRQLGEPFHASQNGGASVWYRWTADVSGQVTIETCGSTFDTLLAVYTGDALDALTAVAGNQDACGQASRVVFTATAGTIYRIAVDGLLDGQGAITLTVRSADSGSANDNFADAQVLEGVLPLTATGSTVGATAEPGEPAQLNTPANASVWYRWTPQQSGPVRVDTCASDFNTALAVYTGSAVDALTLVANNDIDACGEKALVNFDAVAGTTYQIAVDGQPSEQGSVVLRIRDAAGYGADNFADARELSGPLPITVAGTNDPSSSEPGDPAFGGYEHPDDLGHSVWYRWTPTESAVVVLDICDFYPYDLDLRFSVFTGTTLEALTEVASNQNSGAGDCGSFDYGPRAAFVATAGTTYQIAVEGDAFPSGRLGDFTLSLRTHTDPANDLFERAEVLDGQLPIVAHGSNVGSTTETGEPNYSVPDGGINSVWYRWTALAPGPVTIESCGSSFDTRHGVYTGTEVKALTAVSGARDGCGLQSTSTFDASKGTTYSIAVFSGGLHAVGEIQLTIRTPQPPPANDAFASARELSGKLPISITGTNVGASLEAGEPDHAPGEKVGGRSVWFTWTPAQSGLVVIDTCDSSFFTALGVYTGSALDALTAVANSEDGCGLQASLILNATAGTTYRIAVDGWDGGQGSIALHIREEADRPANDDFANAEQLHSNLPVQAKGTNVGATKEAGEPTIEYPVAGHSVWYRWTPSQSATVAIETCGSEFDGNGFAGMPLLRVFTGSALNALTPASEQQMGSCGPGDADRTMFPAVAGTTYHIWIDGYQQGQGSLELAIRPASPPPNDNFASAEVLKGTSPIKIKGSTVDATREPDDPESDPNSVGMTVWYSWTPTHSGQSTIDTCGSSFRVNFAVYTLDPETGLEQVTAPFLHSSTCGEQKIASFAASDGVTYYVMVEGASGSFELAINSTNGPANDHFADAQALSGKLPLRADGTFFGATHEEGEPQHAGVSSNAVWYRWTADSTGPVVIETCGSELDSIVAVYTGESVGALTRVTESDNRCGKQSRVRIEASAGVTYRIAIDSEGSEGTFAVTIRPPNPPANDNFASAELIRDIPLPMSVKGTNDDATRETGEPRHATEGSGSIWYRWAPTFSGEVTVDTTGTSFGTSLAVYTGNSLNGLTRMASGQDDTFRLETSQNRVTFSVTAGTTYLIAIDGQKTWGLSPDPGMEGPIALNFGCDRGLDQCKPGRGPR